MSMSTKLFITLILIFSISLDAEDISLGTINVEAEAEEAYLSNKTSKNTQEIAKQAKGETLGDYIEDEQFVDSASYGPAVGRPVIKGMDGYRVGIATGNIILNDLSAMSQDHAVGVMPRSSQRIELIKGPSSLLYGNYSGGVIHVLGEEHENKLLNKGFSLDLNSKYGSNGAGYTNGAIIRLSDHNLSLFASTFYSDADNYNDGSGKKVKDSDTESLQSHIVLAYQLNKNNIVKLYIDKLEKDYGIPNSTNERTTIDMEQETYGIVFHNKELIEGIDRIQTEIRYSDYLHSELEGKEADGLFGQTQLGISSQIDFFTNEWAYEIHAQYLDSELQVCHEHGKCTKFTNAQPSTNPDGLYIESYYNSTGLAYSHGHPMPNIYEKTSQLGLNATTFLDDDTEFTTTLSLEHRLIEPDNINMQKEWLVTSLIDPNYYDTQTDTSISLSTGITGYLSDDLTYQTSIAYIERLPSASEIFWNGFHHATNTYIFGNRYIENEESINLDLTLMHKVDNFTTLIGGFYYDFNNYIFQEPLADNIGDIVKDDFGHDADVWQIKGLKAKVYGIFIQENFKKSYKAHKFTSTLSFEAIKGVLKDGGYIPRISPYNTTFKLDYKYNNLNSNIKYKYVDKSRFEAQNETHTPSYGWLSAYISYAKKLSYISYDLYIKGENLTDKKAYNHLSFLKETAPLPGRQITLGVDLKF